MNRNRKRVMAGAMAVVMTTGVAGAYGYQGAGTQVMAKEETTQALEGAANAVLEENQTEDGGVEGGMFKEESVYVKADTAGNVSKTTVTEWLKNPENGELADVSGLKDIRNIKGEEEFAKGNGQELTWRSEGSDIYYQGTTDEKLPVDVSISYKLDGKDIKAEDLAGKDGKLEIHIDYKNHLKEQVEIDGEPVEMYTPFTMVTSMMLPTDEYTNVTIDNGKIMSDADKNIVVGLGFPGLTENLKLKELDLDIPESVTITADVKDASVGPTVTVASAEIMEEFDLSDVHDFDSLKDSIHELEDASEKLEEGSKEASDGASQLADGTKKAVSGAKELADGAKEASDGAKELADGAKETSDGADQLFKGTKEAADGAKTLADGSKSAAKGAKELADGSKTLSAGVNELNSKSGELATGVDSLADGVNAYTSGVSSLANGIGETEKGAKELAAGAEKLKGSVEAAYSGACTLADGCAALAQAINNIENTAGNLAGNLGAAESSLVNAANALAGADTASEQFAVTGTSEAAAAIANMVGAEVSAAEIQAMIDSYVSAVSVSRFDPSAEISYAMSEINNAQSYINAASAAGGSDASTTLGGLVSQLNTGSLDLKNGLAEINEGAAALSGGASQLSGGVSELSQGAAELTSKNDQLTGGANQLKNSSPQLLAGINGLANGVNALSVGADTLADGNQQLAAGAGALSEGNQQLFAGAGALLSGNQRLAAGAGALSEGNQQLFAGAGTLADGNQQLADGAGALADGNRQLADGMSEFKTSGIDKLTDVFDNDIQSVRSRIDAMSDLGKNYKSFAGIREGMDGSTKFIIETKGVEK